MLGFVSYSFILDLGCVGVVARGMTPLCNVSLSAIPATRRLDHIYSTWYFWALNVLLAASLAACSATTQWPQLQVGLNWRFAASTKALGAPRLRQNAPPCAALPPA